MTTNAPTPSQVIVIDSAVTDWKTLVAGMSPDIPVILLPAGGDGVAALAQALSSYGELSALHLVTHGGSGYLQLGDTRLDDAALTSHSSDLAAIASHLAPGADILAYGCSVAAGDTGKAFVDDLSKAMGGADIAASTDRTGPLSLGGDWDLEYTEGHIETVLPFTVQGMQGIDECLGCINGSTVTTTTFNDGSCSGDHTPPTVSSIQRVDTDQTSASTIHFSVAFSESVTGVDASDFTLTTTGSATGIIGSVSGSGSTYTVTVTVNSVTGDGSLRLDLKSSGTGIKDTSNNAITTGYTSGQTYTVDHTAPSAPSTPDMSSGTDTGSSSTDNITNSTTPIFTGTAEAGATVKLYDTDGSTLLGSATATGGNWSITSSALSAGTHTLTAKATDTAGNVSTASSGLSVTVDTSAPTGLGLSATTVVSANATSTSTIAGLSATDSQSITYTLATGNGTNDADNGSFTISGSSLKVGGSALTAGTYKIYVAATDAAGNAANQAFTITVVDAPSVSSIVRAGGASATVAGTTTSVNYTVTFDQSVTGVDASDFSLTGTDTAAGAIASVSGSGTTYTVTVDTLSGDGTLRLDLNSSGTGIQNGSSVGITGGYTSGATYALDHTNPNAPSTPDMTAGTDTGPSSSDDITKNTTPTFTGTAESGATVTLYDTDGTTSLGTAIATGGNWSITSSTLSAGTHTLTAKATDAAGNVSTTSSGLSVTIDATNPALSLDSGALAYTENDAAASISAGATLVETGSPGSSVLTVQITTNGEAADVLSLPTATSTGINIDGSNNLRSGTTNIGTVTASSVTNGTQWTLTFLSSATAADIQDTLRAISYHNTSDNPGTSNRTVSFTLTDGAGNSASATRDIAVTAVNDAPTDISLSATTASTYDTGTNVAVGTLGCTDADGGGPTYSIVSVNGDTGSGSYFSLFNISGTSLQAANPSTTPPGTYAVVLRVNDGTSNYDKSFNITISNALTVTSSADESYDAGTYSSELADGAGLSLREAVAIASSNGGGTINFGTGTGSLTLGSSLSIAQNITLDADSIGTLTLASSSGSIGIGSGQSLTVTNGSGDYATVSAALSGTGNLVKTGAGTLTLSGNNTYTGSTTISAGGLTLDRNGGALSDSSAVTVASGATLTLAQSDTIGSVGGAGNVDLGSSTLTTGGAGLSTTFSGVISGTGSLAKAGSGTFTLSGTNTYSGSTMVSTGTLTLSGGSALSDSSAVTVSSGATLGLAASETIGSLAGAGTVTLGSNTLTAGADNTSTSFSGAIGGTGGLTKTGTGTLTLSGNSTYTGATTVSAGGLTVSGGNAIADTSAVTVASGATLTVSTWETIGSLAGAGNVILGGNNLATGGDGTSTTFSGILSGSGGHIVKTGSGNLTLAGTNTYSGDMDLAEGSLSVTGTLAGTTTVESDTTLNGTGTISGAVTVWSDGTLAPGVASVGTLALGGGLTAAEGGVILAMDIHGSTAGSGYDQINVTGTVDVTDATLAIDLGSFTPAVGNSFTLINNDSSDAITGTVKVNGTSLAQGDTFVQGGKTFQISYTGGEGSNDLVLTVINNAPVLDATQSPTFTAIDQDVANSANTGTNVADLVVDGSITDAQGAVEAIAVTAVDNTHGAWQYSTDNGASWTAFAATAGATVDLSTTARLLDGTLTGAGTQKIRFVPDSGYSGAATITFRAWDDSSGTAGGTADTSTNGGTTAFSSAFDTAGITVNAAYVPPPVTITQSTVDGVSLQTQTTTDSQTGIVENTITVPVITTARTEDSTTQNASLADIPLGVASTTTAPKADLTVSLPTGTGMQAEGPQTTLTGTQALQDLIGRIEQKTTSGSATQTDMTGQGQSFLDMLGNRPLLTRTVVPTVSTDTSGSTTSSDPVRIVVSGGTESVLVPDATHQTTDAAIGMVIDTRQLPTNSTIQLDNVEFAAIVGSARVVGGAGQNYVVGDDASQYIVCGPDNDTLDGGAGNDTVGSAGGNDVLFGGAGDDVMFGGVGNDTLDGGTGTDVATFSGNVGQYSFSILANGDLAVSGVDGSDTLRNFEYLRFDNNGSGDATMSLVPTPQLDGQAYYAKIQAYFLAMAGRPATSTELSQYASLLAGQSGNVWKDASGAQGAAGSLVGTLGASADFAALTAGKTNGLLVDEMYERLTGNVPGSAIHDYYVALLDHGGIKLKGLASAMLNDLALMPDSSGRTGRPASWSVDLSGQVSAADHSGYQEHLDNPEYYAKIQAYFLAMTGRAATAAELSTYSSLLDSQQGNVGKDAGGQTGTTGSLLGRLGASSEFAALTAGKTNSQLVDDMFQRLTGDTPSSSIHDYYVAQLDAGSLQAKGLANTLLNDLALMPNIQHRLGQPGGWQASRFDSLTTQDYIGYLHKLELVGINISNVDAAGNLV